MKIVRDLLNVKIMANSSLMTQEMKKAMKLHEDKIINLDDLENTEYTKNAEGQMMLGPIEMKNVAEYMGNVELLHKLTAIPDLTLKFVATNQSLYV